MKQLVLDLIPPAVPGFVNFVPGSNREALEACQHAVFGPIAPGTNTVLYLWGETGSGKSHLLRAIATAVEAHWLFADQSAIATVPPAAQHYLCDDVELLTDAQQQVLFNLINQLNQPDSAACLVATGKCAPRDLPLRPELSSRLAQQQVLQLHPLTDDEKWVALKAHANARGFHLRDDVANYLLRHAHRDMPTLVGWLDRLDAYSLESGREITLPLLRDVLQHPEH